MNDSNVDLDRIVGEVVRRLQRLNGQASQVTAGAETEQPAVRGTLRLGDRLVTMSRVAKQLNGVRQLVVPRRAIVTPAVCDELRARQITLLREESQSRHAVIVLDRKPRLIVTSDEQLWSSRELPRIDAVEMEQVFASDLPTQLQQIEDRLESRGGIRVIGLFITRRPYVVACEANRRRSFRAAVVEDLRQATEARATLDANLFVARPSAPFRLRGIIRAAIE